MFKLCNGKPFEIPIFDPLVAEHFGNANNLVQTLIHQINEEKMYARFFEKKKDLTFLDIGANIGLVSLYASPACSRIVSVEPAPATFEVLKAMTHKVFRIEVVNAALAPRNGPHEFFVNDINSTASSTVNTYGKRIEVPGLTLSSILSIGQLEKVDICKIDAEGAEGESLSWEELKAAEPVVQEYYIELHNCPTSTWGQKLGNLVNHLSVLGYHKQRIEGMALIASRV